MLVLGGVFLDFDAVASQDSMMRTSALEAYAHWRGHGELCLITFLFYCPHYIVISSILVPYLCLPSMYASSTS